MNEEEEETSAERMKFLLNCLEMEFMNSESEIPIDYACVYPAIAELRQLIYIELGE